jgi:hypothetical protein
MFQKCLLPPSSGRWEDSHLHTCCHKNLKSHKPRPFVLGISYEVPIKHLIKTWRNNVNFFRNKKWCILQSCSPNCLIWTRIMLKFIKIYLATMKIFINACKSLTCFSLDFKLNPFHSYTGWRPTSHVVVPAPMSVTLNWFSIYFSNYVTSIDEVLNYL